MTVQAEERERVPVETDPVPLLRMEGIVKSFPGVKALRGVSLELQARARDGDRRRERRGQVVTRQDAVGRVRARRRHDRDRRQCRWRAALMRPSTQVSR